MYNLNPTESSAQAEHVVNNPYVPERDNNPGFWGDAGVSFISGIGEGVAQTNRLVNEGLTPAVQAFTRPLDDVLGTHAEEYWNQKFLQGSLDTVHYLQPDPRTTGFLGNVLHGLATVGTQAGLGFLLGGPPGAAAVAGASQFSAGKNRALDQGVDPLTATGIGAIEGTLAAAGVLLPGAVGTTLRQQIFSGAAINAGIGAAQRGATRELLFAAGYDKMAQQYRVLDRMALLTDAILGAGFGAMHGLGAHEPTRAELLPSDIDNALAANDIHNVEIDTAPGIPVDMASRNAHVEAMAKATEQLLRGEPVDVAREMAGSTEFLSTPKINKDVIDLETLLKEHDLELIAKKNDKAFEKNKSEQTVSKEPSELLPAREPFTNNGTQFLKQDNTVTGKNAEKPVSAAETLAANSVEKTPEREIPKADVDNGIMTHTAAEALQEANVVVKQAKEDATLFDVAVNCFLGYKS